MFLITGVEKVCLFFRTRRAPLWISNVCHVFRTYFLKAWLDKSAVMPWLPPYDGCCHRKKRSFLWNAFSWLQHRSFSLRCAGLLLPAPSPLLLHYLLPAILASSQINGGHPLVLDCAQPIYFGTPLSKHRENFFQLLRCMFSFYCLLDFRKQRKKTSYFFLQLLHNKTVFACFCTS